MGELSPDKLGRQGKETTERMTIDDFLNYLRYERNYSERTVQSYGDDLGRFETFFKSQDGELTWESVDSDVVRDWVENLMDRGNNATSIKRRLSALRSFYRFALSRGYVTHDPARRVENPKGERALPQFLRESEMDTLLDDVAWSNDYNNVRARTIILLFYETGLRLAELIGLDDGSIDWEAGQLKVTGKRNKQRLIPFGREVNDALRHYIEVRDTQVPRNCPALFVTRQGERMNHNQVRYEVKKNLTRVSSLKKRTPHVLRHTFATAMLNHEAGLESVKKLLGHESLMTTEIYTHTTFEQLKKVYEHAHPRS